MKLAIDAGASKIIAFVQAVPGQVILLEEYAINNGLEFVIGRSASEITAHVAADDEILLIADGLYIQPSVAYSIWNAKLPRIATLTAGTDTPPSGFERIDINHFWAGIAKLRGRDLLSLADLPGDWSVQSAALRSGVQRDYKRVMISDRALGSGEISIQASAETMESAEKNAVFPSRQSMSWLSERFLAAPFARLMAPYVWKRKYSRNILRGVQLLGAVTAPAAAYFINVSTALLLLAIAVFTGYMRQNLFGFFEPLKNRKYLDSVYWISIAATLVAGLHKADISPLMTGYLALTSVGIYWYYINKTNISDRILRFFHDPLWFALLLAALSILGHLPLAVMGVGIVTLGSVLFSARAHKLLESSPK
ncbi:hypothetical protein [Sphingorhabdus sp. Alg239-R122]|uniref:hypothetical protein n=1 Tax=Sphingorhabdus sp. Alg239-R122 TaxID=2305989 RepID=UPI0013DAF074|nr:hypothetical protein [Sphingorhabdus sp. Alg239-R122]